MADENHTSAASAPVRPRPAIFRALGNSEPPPEIQIGGRTYLHVKTFKHDSWAATALYAGEAGRVVCKFNRRQRIGLLPTAWLGRWLARRERACLLRLNDVPNVPRWSGEVYADGRRQRNAVAHEFISGATLRTASHVGPDFAKQLTALLCEVHARGMAYVDLHKRENILVGDDGRPYLIDFQISFALPHRWPGNGLLPRLLLKLLQQSDTYHLQKHLCFLRRRFGDASPAPRRPWWIRWHRRVAVPLRSLRRWLLVRAGVRATSGRAETEVFPEEGVRGETETLAA